MYFLKESILWANEIFHLAHPCTWRRASIRRCIRLAKLHSIHSIYTVIISDVVDALSHPMPFFYLSRSLDLFAFVELKLSTVANEKAVVLRSIAVDTYLLISLLDCAQRGRKKRAHANTNACGTRRRINIIAQLAMLTLSRKWSHLNPFFLFYL